MSVREQLKSYGRYVRGLLDSVIGDKVSYAVFFFELGGRGFVTSNVVDRKELLHAVKAWVAQEEGKPQ